MNNNNGSITIEYPKPLIAGDYTTVRFIYTLGPEGMNEGGRLRIALPNPGWGKPLVPQHYFWDCYQKGKDRRYTNYDRVNTTAAVKSTTRGAVPFLSAWAGFRKPFGLKKEWKRNYDRWWIEVLLEDDGLDPGDTIILTYGDPERKPLSAYVQRFPDEKLWFLAYVDSRGNNTFSEVEGTPWQVDVEAGEASQIKAVLPSIILKDESPRIRISYLDKVKVRPRQPVDVTDLIVKLPEGGEKYLPVNDTVTSISTELPKQLIAELPVETESSLRITVKDPERGLAARSNPTLMRDRGPRLFWGDIHTQSMFHDLSEKDQVGISCGTPEEVYHYAKNTTLLDFLAITDSATLCLDVWPRIRRAALDANKDGEFVVFQGSELGDNIDAHRNTIFAAGEPEPRRNPNPDPDKPVVMPAHKAQDLFHGRDDVLLTYHHTKVWNNWSRWDPTVESLLEIYSCWGSGEKPGTDLWEVLAEHTGGAQEAWAKGYRLGVCAGSDTHTGTPGRDIWNAERDEMLIYSCGITGVWAEELSREAIFRSLKNRYCYGTTGKRIILEFFLNNCPMGSEVKIPESSSDCRVSLSAYGTDVIEQIEIVKNNLPVATFFPEKEDFTTEWVDTVPTKSGDYYYLRIRQRDNHRAWSSPIWVDLR